MPAAAATFVVSSIGYIVSATATYYAVYAIATLAINYGLSRLTMALAGKPHREQPGTPSREITVRGTVEPMKIIYGQVKTAGFMAFVGTSGTDNRFLHFVIVWAGHQCWELSDHWLDSRRVAVGEINVGGDVTTATFDDGGFRLLVRRFLGSNGQTADTELTSALPATWTTNHRGRGVCYTHFRLDRSEKAFPSGAPNSFFALVKGRLVYDPRLDSTNGGSGSHRFTDATTWGYNNLAALCRRDYISGGSRWYDVATPEPRLGLAAPNGQIDDAFTITAANKCDEDVLIPPASPTTTQKRYTCDMELSCGDSHLENLQKLESCDVGHTGRVSGRYRITSGAYDTPTITLTEDDFLGPVTITTHQNREEVYNYISPVFFDEARDWQFLPGPNITNSSFETADGGQRKRTIELHGTRTSYRAQRIGILHLAKSRHKIAVRFDRLSPKAMAIAENDTFMVNLPEFGFANTVFRCLQCELILPELFVAITARIETSAAYNDPAVGDYAAPDSQTVATPSYDLPNTPLSLTPSARVNGVHLRWTVPTPENSATQFVVYEHTAATPFASATPVWSGQGKSVVIPRDTLAPRYYWVVGQLNGSDSAAFPVGSGVEGRATADIAVGWHVDADGKPASIRAVDGIADRSHLQFGGIGIQLLSTSDNDVAYGFPAIPIDDTATYELTIRHRSSASDSDGLFLRFNELAAALPSGKTHVGATGTEIVVEERDSLVDLVSNGPQPGATVREDTYTYTPTAGTRFASFSMYNWTGFSGTYEVQWVRLVRTGSNANLLNTGAPQVDTGGIVPGAATDVESVEDDTSSLINGGGAVGGLQITPLSALGIDYLLQVTATFDVWITNTGGGTPEFFIDVNRNGVNINSQPSFPTATTSPGQRVTLQCEVPITPSDEAGSGVSASVGWTGAAPAGTAEMRNGAMRCEKIKR